MMINVHSFGQFWKQLEQHEHTISAHLSIYLSISIETQEECQVSLLPMSFSRKEPQGFSCWRLV